MTLERPDTNLAAVKSILAQHAFENPDIGDLNRALDIDYWIVCMPKSSTTSIQRGLERIGRPSIHAHTNPSTYEAFTNGRILSDAGIGMEHIIQARLASTDRKLHFFFGYREPVSWWVSLAGQFSMDFDYLRSNYEHEMSGQTAPWNKYSVYDVEIIAQKAFGIDIRSEPFDHERGLAVLEHEGFNIILYRADLMGSVERYITENIDDRFVMKHDRVNVDERYIKFKREFMPERRVIEKLYDDPWFRYFHTAAETEALLSSFNSGIEQPA